MEAYITKIKNYSFIVEIIGLIIVAFKIINPEIEEKYLLGSLLAVYSVFYAEKIKFILYISKLKEYDSILIELREKIETIKPALKAIDYGNWILIFLYAFVYHNEKMIFIAVMPAFFEFLYIIWIGRSIKEEETK